MSITTSVDATTSDAPDVLRAVDLSCKRGERRLFSGLNLQLAAGQLVWLRADNGRGKTSLLRLLAGLAAPAAGQVLVGRLPVREAAALKRGPVYVGHANALKEDLSAAESLTFMAQLHGRASSCAHIAAALDRLGLAKRMDAPVRTLSQGQRRRIALARLALEQRPLPWILDEPYDALDSSGIAALDGLLAEHIARGGSAILTSHQAMSDGAPAAQALWLNRDGLAAQA